MLNESERKKAAQSMLQAERQVKPVVQLTTTYPDITIEDAYAVQSEVIATKLAAGRRGDGIAACILARLQLRRDPRAEVVWDIVAAEMRLAT